MHVAKAFQNGGSQAIRWPKDFRVPTNEVFLKKATEGFLVIQRNPWELFFEGVRELSDELLARPRRRPRLEKRRCRR